LLQIGEICEEIVPYTNVLPQKSSIDRNLCTNLANALFPFRYLNIVKSEGLEISQPGLDSKLSEIHHRITVRKKSGSFHRRVSRANKECSREGPPCSGWVEGMAPVFSKSAWQCVWHLIQNDLIHGWGIDYKFGYCAQV